MALRSPASPSGPLNLTGPITIAGGAVTVSTPLLNLTQTWNAGAVTFTGILANVTDTASAAASLLLDLKVGGISKFNIDKTGIFTAQGAAKMQGNNVDEVNAIRFSVANDLRIERDAANILALRNGASAQTSRIYNTFTDASNGEWVEIAWSSSVAFLRANKNGTGASRLMMPVTGSTVVASLPAAATAGAGARAFVTDATVTTFASTVVGGGANAVPVTSDGTNWKIG